MIYDIYIYTYIYIYIYNDIYTCIRMPSSLAKPTPGVVAPSKAGEHPHRLEHGAAPTIAPPLELLGLSGYCYYMGMYVHIYIYICSYIYIYLYIYTYIIKFS